MSSKKEVLEPSLIPNGWVTSTEEAINPGEAVYRVNLEKAQEKGSQFWHTRSHAIILYDSVPMDFNEKVGDTILYQRVPTPRPAPKIVLKNAWQVEHGKQTSSEQTCAEGDLFKINLRVQGVPQNAVLQDQGRRTTEQILSLPT